MRMEAGLDTGPVYAARAVPVTGEDETAGRSSHGCRDLGGPLLVEVIDEIAAGRAAPVPQPEEGVSLAPKITARTTARSTSPAPPSSWSAACAPSRRTSAPPAPSAARPSRSGPPGPATRTRPPGLSVEDGRLVAGCGRGSLEILELQPPGRARMDAAAFLRGWRGRARPRARRCLRLRSTPTVARGRSVALRVLRRVDEGAYADRALAAEARRAELDPRARAQATRLAYGAVQRRRTLDWLIDGALDRPAALEPAVRDILRLGAYEIAFSDGVPARAAVDQAVRQARALRGSTARASARAGVVNAVLRRIADEAPARLAGLDAGGAEGGALRYSMPDWIAERLVASLGVEDAMRTMEAAGEPAESALRWNPLRGPRVGLESELPSEGWRRDDLAPEAYVALGPVRARGLAGVGPRPGDGAEPRLAARRPDRGPAAGRARARPLRRPRRQGDPSRGAVPRRRADHGRRAAAGPGAPAARAGAPHGRRHRGGRGRRPGGCASRAASTPSWSIRRAPASACCRRGPTPAGAGARRRSGRWWSSSATCSPAALALTRPGGRVVYSTCTLIAEENEDVVRAVGGRVDDLAAEHPGLAHPRLPGALLTLPHRDHTDGFFVARLRAGEARVSPALPERPFVLPSLMSADLLNVGAQLDALIAAGARVVPRGRHGRPLRAQPHPRVRLRAGRRRSRSTPPGASWTCT